MSETRDDMDLIVFLAGGVGGGCSLDSSPKKNWVENSGGLPKYICEIARSIKKSGKSTSSAIAIAVSRVKKWAAGGDDVEADTRAKAAKALAQWEALKKRNKAKQLVKATNEAGEGYVMLSSIPSFNTELVRRSWNDLIRQRRAAYSGSKDAYEAVPHSWVRELWTDFIIVEDETGPETKLTKIPYTVENDDVTFGDPVEVKTQYVEVSLSAWEKNDLGDLIKPSPLEKIVSLAATL